MHSELVMRTTRRLALAVPTLILLATSACSEPADDLVGAPPRTSPTTSPQAPDGPVPEGATVDVTPASAEASAVATQLAMGLEADAVSSLAVGRLLAVDWNDRPFVYLVFTSPSAGIATPLVFGGAEDAREPEKVRGATTTVVGADTTRGDVAYVAHDLALLADLQVAMRAADGAANVAKIVAASPTRLAVVTKDGRVFGAGMSTPLAPELVAEMKKEWEEHERSADAERAREQSRAIWRARREGDGSTPKPGIAKPSLADATRPDGNLDLRRAAELVDVRGFAAAVQERVVDARRIEDGTSRQGFASTTNDQCWSWWFFGWHTACDTTEHGKFAQAPARQAHRAIQSQGYTVPFCGPLKSRFLSPGIDTNAWTGCGPAAATSLIWRAWVDGETFTSLADVPKASAGSYDASSYAPGFEKLVGTPLLEDMSSCSSGASQGTGTYHWDFVNGTNAWLTRNGSRMRMTDAWSVPGFHGFDAPRKADLLHRLVGIEERPVIAAFDTAGAWAGSHFAPVDEYRIVRHVNPLLGTDVWIRGLDEGQSSRGWYSLSNPWNLASALYWLER